VKTTELQPYYAPDITIVGASLGGIIPNGSYLIGDYSGELVSQKPYYLRLS
jgi:hypothetical protein